MWYTANRNETDRERYLRQEVERLEDERREESARRLREEDERREQRQRNIRECIAAYNRSADDWPEALRKQESRCQREADQYPYIGDDGRDFFADSADAARRALVLWDETVKEVSEEMAVLRAKLAALEAKINQDVADKLDAESQLPAWRSIAEGIRGGDIESFLDW